MKIILLVLVVFLNGCEFVETTQSDEIQYTAIPLADGIFQPADLAVNDSFVELKSWSNDVLVYRHHYFADLAYFNPVEESVTQQFSNYLKMTREGWEYSYSAGHKRYSLNHSNDLVINTPSHSTTCKNATEQSIAGQSINTALTDYFSWANSFTFNKNAKIYTCKPVFTQTIRVIDNLPCESNCLQYNTLTQWKNAHAPSTDLAVRNGYDWQNLTIFLDNNGELKIYSSSNQEIISSLHVGTWRISEIYTEEILELTIPLDIKQRFGILEASDPIITIYEGVMYEGMKYTPIEADLIINELYFLNHSAMEDIKNAYISTHSE